MSIFNGLFKSIDSTSCSFYRFLMGGSTSGKPVNERSAMQMMAENLITIQTLIHTMVKGSLPLMRVHLFLIK